MPSDRIWGKGEDAGLFWREVGGQGKGKRGQRKGEIQLRLLESVSVWCVIRLRKNNRVALE